MMLGDGLFHVVYMLIKTASSLVTHKSVVEDHPSDSEIENYDEKRRTELFLTDQIPVWVAFLGYGFSQPSPLHLPPARRPSA